MMKIMWKPILLFRFSLMFLEFSADAQSNDKNPWALRMVNNVRWDLSRSYLAAKTEDAHGKEHLGQRVMPGYEGTKMSFFYGLNYDNMLIQFDTYEDTGAAYCKIGVITENAEKAMEAAFAQTGKYKEENCTFQRQKIYKYDGEIEHKKKLMAFCPIQPEGEVIEWVVADGVYNRPAKAPQCLRDFHMAARAESFEYDLFRYCAKGYFFNGKNYDNPARLPEFRRDWLLYLAEGKVTCGISGNAEEDKSLLEKGYTVELVHRFEFAQVNEHNGMKNCPYMEAILTSYHDNDSEGKFFFGAVVGPGQLDGYFQWSDRRDKKWFWSEEAYMNEYKTMSLGERGCYLHYHNWNRMPNSNRYYLELRVTHYCTGRAMRDRINFDVSIARENAPEGFHEDSGIIIDLSAKTLERTTGQALCAKEMLVPDPKAQSMNLHQQPQCVKPPRQTFGYSNLDDVCDQKQAQCKFGARCTIAYKSVACNDTKASCNHLNTNDYNCGDCVCRRPTLNYANGLCKYDMNCPEHKFCANSDKFEMGECKKMHYKEEDEPCWSSAECFPGFGCFRSTGSSILGLLPGDPRYWGYCADVDAWDSYQCPAAAGCQTQMCPKEMYWSNCVTPIINTGKEAGCKKNTYAKVSILGFSDDFGQGLDDCGLSDVRYQCCL